MRRREERPWDHTTGDGNSKDDLIDRRMVINKAFECGKRERLSKFEALVGGEVHCKSKYSLVVSVHMLLEFRWRY